MDMNQKPTKPRRGRPPKADADKSIRKTLWLPPDDLARLDRLTHSRDERIQAIIRLALSELEKPSENGVRFRSGLL